MKGGDTSDRGRAREEGVKGGKCKSMLGGRHTQRLIIKKKVSVWE